MWQFDISDSVFNVIHVACVSIWIAFCLSALCKAGIAIYKLYLMNQKRRQV